MRIVYALLSALSGAATRAEDEEASITWACFAGWEVEEII